MFFCLDKFIYCSYFFRKNKLTKIDQNLEANLKSVIKDIFSAVAEENVSVNSAIFKAASLAKKTLEQSNEKNSSLLNKASSKNGMLVTCLEVTELILKKKLSFPEACKRLAKSKNITDPSIRQACCRSQGLTAYQWNQLYRGNKIAKDFILNILISRYPFEKDKILEIFKI